MLIAAWHDGYYNAILFIHILSFLIAFAPAVMNPLLANYFKREGDERTAVTWAGFTSFYTSRVSLTALGVLLVTGIWMITISSDLYDFSQAWVSAAFVVWLAIGGVVSAMILKGEKAIAAGDTSGEKLVSQGGAIATVLGAVMLYLMIFKPGL